MSTTSSNKPPVDLTAIQQAHQLYGQLTAQTLRLAFDRERMWYELLSAGYTLQDLRAVITYLQREIRAQLRRIEIFDGERLEVIDGWGVTKGGRVRAG